MKYPKKLIEVALPLDVINREASREKSVNQGHPKTIHLWWARRPAVAARAVLFAQLVNDPGDKVLYPKRSKKDAEKERARLFSMIGELVKWENTTNEPLLASARAEIRRSWEETCKVTGDDPNVLPPFLDPFSGGGTIPMEAQRLGLTTFGSDLNPVAVMIGKALVEIPYRFSNLPPVGPVSVGNNVQDLTGTKKWEGVQGLAEDVSRYGSWMREEAFRQIGHLYPQVVLPKAHGGGKASVVVWLWVRTVASPHPAYKGTHVPLASSFVISSKKGKEAYVVPELSKDGKSYSFVVRNGTPPEEAERGTKLGRGANFNCVLSNSPIDPDYIKAEGMAKRLGVQLMAVVAEGTKGRVYLSPSDEMESLAKSAKPVWSPNEVLNYDPKNVWCPLYGLETYAELYSARQLVALTTFSDLLPKVHSQVLADAKKANMVDDGRQLDAGGNGATAYADAITVYLACALNRAADGWSSLTSWRSSVGATRSTFARQALPMVWDFAEANPFSQSCGNWVDAGFGWVVNGLLGVSTQGQGTIRQQDARSFQLGKLRPVVSTDPPYYDNIGYADLSDFFYVWLRHNLKPYFPSLFSTLLVPKAEELIANPYRNGGKDAAEKYFLDGMTGVFKSISEYANPVTPVTIYYAFKQADNDENSVSSTGWETFLQAVISAGFVIEGTWPLRTERLARSIGIGANALASSILLVCRPKSADAETISRKRFIQELESEVSEGLEIMIGGETGASPIAPVDLAQAAIGPGIGVYSRYAAVLEADGKKMDVRDALVLINKAVDEFLTHAESDMDSDTRFCVDWFQQYGFQTSAFGGADVLARAKGTSVEGLVEAGVAEAKGGKVRLLKIADYSTDWDPAADRRLPIWEACHQLARALQVSESEAGRLLSRMPEKAEPVRQLAYRLYTVCERKGWAEEAGHYNALVTSWHAIADAAQKVGTIGAQGSLL